MSRDWREQLAELAGTAPPAVLRARLVPDAHEVLICSYTADLRFFESTCLGEARAVGARVTVVHDDAKSVTPADELHYAGTAYTDVPVRCRSGGEFHPKLVLIAGEARAVAAIGSGNVTSAGWHHNAELWTVIGADADEWPSTFTGLADWLARLPDALHIDPFGASRLRDVADLLGKHQPVASGPVLVHNLDQPIMRAVPDLAQAGGVDELLLASPFLDPHAAALTGLTRRLSPADTTLALTPRAVGPAGAVATWADKNGSRVHAIAGSRYHHGKLVQWRRGQSHTALIGSANITAAAMLRRTRESHGNCELGLILDTDDSLLPALRDDPLDAAELEEQLSQPPDPEDDDRSGRLLSVLAEDGHATAYLADTGVQVAGAHLVLPSTSVPAHPGTATPGTVALVADVTVAPGTVCSVRLADGTLLGPVRATDPVGVRIRPGTASPLEEESLARVLGHPQLSAQLFEALAELAKVRPDQAPGAAGHSGAIRLWRSAAERSVGPALVMLALGGHRQAASKGGVEELGPAAPADDAMGTSPGDAADEFDEDDDVGTWDDEEVDTGITNVWDVTSDPVSLLLSSAMTAERLARMLLRRIDEAEKWELPAVLALLKVSLLVAAGGGWARNWPAAIADLLECLKSPPSSDELEPSRQAAGAVALAALASVVDDWATPSQERTWFEEIRNTLALRADLLEPALVAHYAADLHLGLGSQLTAEAVLDSAEFLITKEPLARVVEELAQRYPSIRLAAPRLLELETSGSPRTTILRLLSQYTEYAPVAVRVFSKSGTHYGAWRPQHLILHDEGPHRARGAEHRLPVGPGAYTAQPLPTPGRSWTGPIPSELRQELADQGLLDSER